MNTSILPKQIISEVLYKQTGVEIPPEQIDYVTAYNIANAVVALDAGFIDMEKYNCIVIFQMNILLDRESHEMYFTPQANFKLAKSKYAFQYSELFLN